MEDHQPLTSTAKDIVKTNREDAPPTKRPYILTTQKIFLQDVIDLSSTKESLYDPEDTSKTETSDPETASPASTLSSPVAMEDLSIPETLFGGEQPQPASGAANRRRRGGLAPFAQVDNRALINSMIIHYLNQSRKEEETFLRSLAPHLRKIPQNRQLRTKAALMAVLEAATPPNDPQEFFMMINQWLVRAEASTSVTPPPPTPQRPRPSTPRPLHCRPVAYKTLPPVYSQEKHPNYRNDCYGPPTAGPSYKFSSLQSGHDRSEGSTASPPASPVS
ncbi:uncharacterized protein LOC122942332 [Bufo gargarizans]|uniref:uncharacterized protein LOC122942332 n=1 Tax=Bufo gargarizans TaxID=30331 RepID=UPI001CF208D9|nr:uncharacterized protein LOC122942332 [Bufo gargarizans]